MNQLKSFLFLCAFLCGFALLAQDETQDSTDNYHEWIEISFMLNNYFEEFNHVWQSNGHHFKSLDCPKSVPEVKLLEKFKCSRMIDSLKFEHQHFIEGYDSLVFKSYAKEQLEQEYVLLINYDGNGFQLSSYSIVNR